MIQELTVFHCLLPTSVAFPLFFLLFLSSTSNFWPCGSTFHKQNMFCSSLFLYQCPLYWGLFLAPVLPNCFVFLLWSSNFLPSIQSVPLFLYRILLQSLSWTAYFPVGTLYSSLIFSSLFYSAFSFYPILPTFPATLLLYLEGFLPLPTFFSVPHCYAANEFCVKSNIWYTLYQQIYKRNSL